MRIPSGLSGMRRVTQPGGRVAAMENDISLVWLDPPCPAVDEVWSAFVRYQQQLGGDGLIGRQLFRLFTAASLQMIELLLQPEVHWHGFPGFAGWVDNLLSNIRNADQGLLDSGFCTTEQLTRAKEVLTARLHRPVASLLFAWNRAMAVR